MKNLKKLPTKQLEKFSTVFVQLGLVLALFVVYALLEHQTLEKHSLAQKYVPDESSIVVDFDRPIVYEREIIKPKPEPQVKKVETNLSNIEKVDNEDKQAMESVINKSEDIKPQIFNPDDIVEVEEPTDIIETVPFILIEEVPIYRGCEGLSKNASKECFVEKITKHVQRHFNSELGQDLGLRAGKHKIYAQFIIDKVGDVTQVNIRAPHKRLEKETQRIVDIIPQFTPGKQRGKPVKVKYTLPITFKVE